MFAIAATSTCVPLLPVALKGLGELHRAFTSDSLGGQRVFASDALARQGLGPVGPRGLSEKQARQRAGGISGPGIPTSEPGYIGRVPSRNVAGDQRGDYQATRGNATSSRGILGDILGKVPRKTHGSAEYKRINRPQPKRTPGFDNTSALP